MIKDLSRADSDYFKTCLKDARSFQEKEFLNKIDTELYKSYYTGDNYRKDNVADVVEEDEYITLNKVFPATNRVVPTLYYQNPKIVFTPRKGTTDFSAKILTAVINYDYKEMRIKQENQQIVLDAWYSGFGACKLGYLTNFVYKSQDKTMMQKIKGIVGLPDKEEKIIDYIEYEGTFARRINPKDIFRDPKQPAGKDRIIWIHYKKTLEDIVSSDMYEYESDFITRFKTKDMREVELDLYEGMCVSRKDGLYIIAVVDGYPNPIRYEKSSWKGDGFPMSFLSFSEINDMHYPPSFLQVTSKQQKHINFLTTLQFNVINKFRNQTGVNENALTEEGKRTLKSNDIAGIVKFKVPLNGQIAPITSANISADLFNVQGIMQENLQECMQVAGMRSGSAANEPTLGQDQIKDMGNQIGLNGMQAKVQDFVIEQATKLAQFRKQFSTAPSLVPIVGMDLVNPITGQLITDEWLEFGTPNNPVSLKDAIAGDYDIEVDIKSAQKPDDTIKLKLFENLIATIRTPEMQQYLASDKKKINWSKLITSWLDVYSSYIPTVGSFVTDMTMDDLVRIKKQELLQAQQVKDQSMMQSETMQGQRVDQSLNQTKKALSIEKDVQQLSSQNAENAMKPKVEVM